MGNTQTFRGKVQLEELGNPWRQEAQANTVPGSTITLASYVVPAGKQTILMHCHVTCRHEGILTIKIAGSLVGSMRTGPGNVNAEMNWVPYREALETETILVEFEALGNKPITSVETYIHGREV